MSERTPDFSPLPEQNPYADIAGQPYPDRPLGMEAQDLKQWFEGMRAIEKRMKAEEKAVVMAMREEVSVAGSQQEVEEIVKRWNTKSPMVSTRDTVAVRNFVVDLANGEEVSMAILFEARMGIEFKDAPVRYTVHRLP